MGFCDEMLEKVEQESSESIRPEKGDYIVDGLLYCHKCHTPKQVRIEILGMVRTPMCLCKCMAEEKEREDAERKREEFQEQIQRMRSIGFPDSEMSNCTFANDDHANERITGICHKYVDHFPEMREKGKGLLLFGGVGTGKTFMASCIANALIDQGYPCMVTNFARIINTLQGMYEGKQDYIDGLNKFTLLVIDDLAAERDTEYMAETVQNIIDARYRTGLPLIITTNLTAEELKHPAEIRKQRIYSRLFEMCVPIEVKGMDRRKEKLKTDYGELEELLGL